MHLQAVDTKEKMNTIQAAHHRGKAGQNRPGIEEEGKTEQAKVASTYYCKCNTASQKGTLHTGDALARCVLCINGC